MRVWKVEDDWRAILARPNRLYTTTTTTTAASNPRREVQFNERPAAADSPADGPNGQHTSSER